MTPFYYDEPRQLLIYPRSDLITHAIPEARELNGAWTAVPRNLRNSQILRHFNYPVTPVITDQNYNWPRSPTIKNPYESQKLTANFLVLNPRAFVLSDMGCVAGETLLETFEGKVPIEQIALRGSGFKLKSCTNSGVAFVDAQKPFCKGVDRLYKVDFASGRSITVTKNHVFLTSRGWLFCADLAAGEQIPIFDASLQASNSEFCLSKFLQDARRSNCTLQGYWGDYQSPSYGAQLLPEVGSVPASIPLQAGFPAHTRFAWRMDDRGIEGRRSPRIDADLLSKIRYIDLHEKVRRECLLSEYATIPSDSPSHTYERYPQFSIPAQLAPADSESQLYNRPFPALKTPVDTVTHITYLRTDVYYDLHVPKYENYIAHGLCHHNSGKTLSILWAADYLMRQHPKGEFRALIICPLSIMQRVWKDAIWKSFLGNRTVEILHGTPDKREAALAKKTDFGIVNFDGVGTGAHTRKKFELDGFSKTLEARKDIKLVIVDEASGYRDAQTKRHRLARMIFGDRPYIWLATGTPTPNAPTDAYGLAKLVNNAYGKSFMGFRMETMLKASMFKWVPQKDGYEKARRLLSPSIRFDIKDVWGGPELTTQQREVQLTPEQKKLMADLKRDLILTVKSGVPITAANEAAARTKFMQISLGAVYDEKHKVHLVDAKPRVEELKAVISEAQGKILIFAPLTSVVNYLYKELNKVITCAIVNGDVSQKERSQVFLDFQEKESPRAIIADPGCMAHGLDLWMARAVIFYGPTDKTEVYLQAIKRAHRPGQRFPVTVVQLVSNPLEMEIYKRLANNESLQGLMLDMVRKGEI